MPRLTESVRVSPEVKEKIREEKPEEMPDGYFIRELMVRNGILEERDGGASA